MEYKIDYIDFNLEKLIDESLLINDNKLIRRKHISNKGTGVQIHQKHWKLDVNVPYIEKYFYPGLKNYLNLNKNFFLQLWLNLNYPGSYNAVHDHGSKKNVFSGVYYVKVPDNSGDLLFTDSGNTISPKPGMIVLFHSSVRHAVEPNLSNEIRISFAFNYSHHKINLAQI